MISYYATSNFAENSKIKIKNFLELMMMRNEHFSLIICTDAHPLRKATLIGKNTAKTSKPNISKHKKVILNNLAERKPCISRCILSDAPFSFSILKHRLTQWKSMQAAQCQSKKKFWGKFYLWKNSPLPLVKN